jgi:hypothetical protein
MTLSEMALPEMALSKMALSEMAPADRHRHVLQLPFHVECLADMPSVTAGSGVKATLCDGQG